MRIRIDPSILSAQKDDATVSKDGTRLESWIDGVVVSAPTNHVDHRGRVFEIFPGKTAFWVQPVVYAYAFTVRPNQIKGWGLHNKKEDRYTLISGELLTLLYDSRGDSPTHGLVQKVFLTPEGKRQLLIPSGVWHMNICLGEAEAMLVNHPTEVYHHGEPDRLLLPWDSPAIPVDVSSFFPLQH